ncbi:putative transporter SVOPL [Poecile atricapillus]|uniref:putative transporter SVOPL n=1 Tax=Poecile atricapillus TaxID=48891 RepID=UPI002739A44C|nr:putative transporter SVOPL [Poecile atricapillus]
MATAPKEAENAIGLEEIHTERKEPPKGQKTFTVEEAVETIGFGRFHIMLFLIMGSTGLIHHVVIVMATTTGFGKHISQRTKQIPRAPLQDKKTATTVDIRN